MALSSIHKAMVLIDILEQSNTALALKDLANRSGWAKSTVHGLLAELRVHRVVVQDDDGRYRLGLRLFELGASVSRQWSIVDIAKPHLQSICVALNQTVCVAALDRDSVIVIDSVSAASPFRVINDVGTRFPLHASALGKAIWAHLPDAELTALLQSIPLSLYTRHTCTDLTAIQAERERILQQGYAIEDGEFRIGMRAVAAPIFDFSSRVRYAIGVTGMFCRTDDPLFQEAQSAVTTAAQALSGMIRNL